MGRSVIQLPLLLSKVNHPEVIMQKDNECIFCKIVAGEIPCFKLYEDDETLSFMDINPANVGHALVISKEHWQNVYEIPDALIASVAVTVKRIAQAARSALSPDGVNVVQANGKGAAQSVEHFHVHVLPRTLGDDLKLNWGLNPGDMEQVKVCSEKLKSAL